MATQPYRKQSSLMDLVSGASSQPSMSLPQPTPDVSGGGTLSPEERQGLLAALLAPEDIGPAPEQTNPTQAALGMLFSSLGDATNAFNAGRSQQPGFRSNYAGQALDQINQQKYDLQAYNEKKAGAARKAKERGVNYLLSEDEKALEASVRKAAAEAAAKEKEANKQAVLDAAALRRQQELADRQASQDREDVKIKRAQIHDVAMAKLHGRLKTADDTDKVMAREQIKAVGEAKGFINEVAANVSAFAEKAGGPDKVRTFIRRKIEAIPFMEPDALEAAMAYYDKEVQDQYDELSGGPMVPGGGF